MMHKYVTGTALKREIYADVEFFCSRSSDSQIEDLYHDNPDFTLNIEAVTDIKGRFFGHVWSVYDKDRDRIVRRGINRPDEELSYTPSIHNSRTEAAEAAAEDMKRRLIYSKRIPKNTTPEVVIENDFIKVGSYTLMRTTYGMLSEDYETKVGRFCGRISAEITKDSDGIYSVTGFNWDIRFADADTVLEAGYVPSTNSDGAILASRKATIERAALKLSYQLGLLSAVCGDTRTNPFFKILADMNLDEDFEEEL